MNINYQYKTGNCKNTIRNKCHTFQSKITRSSYPDSQMNCNEYKYISQMNNTKIPFEE